MDVIQGVLGHSIQGAGRGGKRHSSTEPEGPGIISARSSLERHLNLKWNRPGVF